MQHLGARIIAVGMLILASAVLIRAQGQLTTAEIEAAVKAGQANRFNDLVSRCTAGPGFGQSMSSALAGGIQPTGSYAVVVSGNAGRVAFMAAESKRLYKPFSLDQLPEDLRTPGVFVTVEPNQPKRSGNTYEVPAIIDRVVLKSKDKTLAVAQPATFEVEPVEWSNLLGGKVAGNRALVTFSIDAVRELPAGDVDVIVITSAGERKCDFNARTRARLFGQ